MGKQFKALIRNIIFLLTLLLAMPAGSALSADSALPVTSGTVVRDYARITFEWPQPVNFVTKADGKTITITFERKANPDFGPLLSSLHPYITSAQRKKDGKTIVLTFDKEYSIRTFMSDNIGGIDLLDIATPEQNLAALTPAAGKDETAPAATSPVAEVSPIHTPNDASALPPDQTAPAPPVPEKPTPTLKVNVSAADDNAVLRLPFSSRMATAVFIRTNHLWIVLNKPVPVDLSDFDALPRTVIGKAELLNSKTATVIRITVDDNIYASVSKEDNSFEWAVLLTSKKRPPTVPLKANINTDPPAVPHVFIPTLQMAESVTIRDPMIGDDLVVMPLYSVGEGIAFLRDFVEFSLLETAQGIAVGKKSDDVTVTPLRNGLRITLPQGATLSPGLPEAENTAPIETMASSITLFPYDSWKLETGAIRRVSLRGLFHRVVESEHLEDANEARLRLAQIYLSEGLAPEALAQLDGIKRTSAVTYRSSKLAALHGAANFLMYRFTDASRDFAASELNNNKEMDYWRNMLADLLGNPAQYDYIAMNPDYISKYPPLFRQRLAIVAADRAVEAKEYNTALKIFDSLHEEKDKETHEDNLLGPINTYVNFLMAKISADTGQEDEGVDMWDKLAADWGHPFVQSRAEFSRIVWSVDHETLTKDQIIDRLERLRLSWHGDGLELKILGMLGDLYNDKKDYINAMRVWDDGVNGFPNSPGAIEMAHKMQDTFVVMFNEGTADSLPTLDALALYYQYRNYAPPGSTGREMISRLADRLVSIDLLEQAASLLEHQMHFESEKVQRSQIGVKVATVYLLNHQPKRALQALEDSVYGENPVLLRMLRNRLAAEALSELDQPDKALQILGQDDSLDAERIRINIFWQKKDWLRVIASVEGILKARKDITAPIEANESPYVIELALAYIFQNDPVQLQYLHDYFGPLMAKNPDKPVFEFVTAGEMPLTPTNFDDVIKYLEDTRSFIDNYKAHIQTAGLDSMMNQAAGTPAKQ